MATKTTKTSPNTVLHKSVLEGFRDNITVHTDIVPTGVNIHEHYITIDQPTGLVKLDADGLKIVAELATRWQLVHACSAKAELHMCYLNHRGEVGIRRIIPQKMWFGISPYHKRQGWHLNATDLDKNEDRDFFISDIKGMWQPVQIKTEEKK